MTSKKNIQLYLFGDSICFGQLISGHRTWASLLAKSLEDLNNNDYSFVVQNAGVNGNTTRQALERLHYDVTSHLPKFVLIQFGMNDCNYWTSDFGLPRVSSKAFAANLEEIVHKCIGSGVRYCFINTNHPSNKGTFKHINSLTYDQSNREYNLLIREAVHVMQKKDLPVTLFDIEHAWFDYLEEYKEVSLRDLLLDDGIHLSLLGHELYSNLVIDKIVYQIKTIINK